MLAGLGSALVYSMSIIVFKSCADHYHTTEILFFQNVLGAFIFLPFFITTGVMPDLQQWSISIGYAILLGIIVFGMFFYGLKHLKASTFSMITYIEFVSGIFLGVILLNEPFTWNMALGATLILLATWQLRKIENQSTDQRNVSTVD